MKNATAAENEMELPLTPLSIPVSSTMTSRDLPDFPTDVYLTTTGGSPTSTKTPYSPDSPKPSNDYDYIHFQEALFPASANANVVIAEDGDDDGSGGVQVYYLKPVQEKSLPQESFEQEKPVVEETLPQDQLELGKALPEDEPDLK